MSLTRSLFSSLSLALLGMLPSAASQAQAVLKLNWGQANPCVFTANANGVSLDPQTGALTATGTFDTTSANSSCPSSAPPGTPTFSNNLASDLAASVATSATTPVGSLTWQADADNCDYTGTSYPGGVGSVANWSTSTTAGAACSSAGTCNTAHSASITLGTDGSYTFALRCYKNGNSTPATTSVTTVASTAPTACQGVSPPAGTTLQATGQVQQYSPQMAPRNNVDMTHWENIWGFNGQDGTNSPFPHINNILQTPRLTKNQYISVKFHTPVTPATPGLSDFRYGNLKEVTTGSTNGVGVSLTISECQGDFRTTLPAKCQANLQTETGGGITFTTDPSLTNFCQLQQDKDYYLNAISAPLSNPSASACTSSSCTHTLQNSWLGWPE